MLTRSQTRNQTSPTSNIRTAVVTRSQSRNKFFEEEEIVRAPTLRNRRAVIVDEDEDDYNSRTHSMVTRSMRR